MDLRGYSFRNKSHDIRVSAFSNRIRRGSYFRNEWVWEFFPEGFANLDTEAIWAKGAPCFVMNGCENFF